MNLSTNLHTALYLGRVNTFNVIIKTVDSVSRDSELGSILSSMNVKGVNGKNSILVGTLNRQDIVTLMDRPDIERISLAVLSHDRM